MVMVMVIVMIMVAVRSWIEFAFVPQVLRRSVTERRTHLRTLLWVDWGSDCRLLRLLRIGWNVMLHSLWLVLWADSYVYVNLSFHSQEWSISHFSCSLTKNITWHSVKNLAVHSFLRSKMIILPKFTTSHIHFSLMVGRMYFLNLGMKGLTDWAYS